MERNVRKSSLIKMFQLTLLKKQTTVTEEPTSPYFTAMKKMKAVNSLCSASLSLSECVDLSPACVR